MTPDEYSEWDAAYVLGALSVSERHVFERHLSGCRSCRTAVSELAPLPGLLAAAPAPATRAAAIGETEAAASDHSTLTSLAERARSRQRRGRMLLAAAAVGLLFVGGAAGFAVTQALDTPAVVAADDAVLLDPVDGSGVEADLTLTGTPWGTRLDWSCSYPPGAASDHDYGPSRDDYELAVIDVSGIRTVVATWSGDGRTDTTGLAAASSTPIDEIARIELSAAPSGAVLAATDY